jgi:hypothetical protein
MSVKEHLSEVNPDALLADGFESCFIGMTCGSSSLAVYDYDACVEFLIQRDKMTYGDAVEFMEFNVIGARMGDHTPVFVLLDRG